MLLLWLSDLDKPWFWVWGRANVMVRVRLRVKIESQISYSSKNNGAAKGMPR